MPRQRRGSGGDEEAEIDLVPFMNMVVILIPLLLLSVVFLKIGVINITAPKLSVGPPSEEKPEKDEKPLNLTVAVNSKGFRIAATGAVLPPQGDCPDPGPTVCLSDQAMNVSDQVKQARQAFENGQSKRGEKLLAEALKAYDWPALYNQLMKIKKQYPDETIINVSGDPDIPYAFVVRVMDVARYKLKKDSYQKSSEFWSSEYKPAKSGKGRYQQLFSDPVLAVAK